jgi:hypothetical protein
VQEWHGARETSSGNILPGTVLNKKPRKDEQRRDAGKAHYAKRE